MAPNPFSNSLVSYPTRQLELMFAKFAAAKIAKNLNPPKLTASQTIKLNIERKNKIVNFYVL